MVLGELFLDPFYIGGQIGYVGGDSAFREVAERKDIPVFIEICNVVLKHD